MKNYLFTAVFLVSFFSFSQSNWEVKSNFWGVGLYENGNKISVNDAIEKAKDQENIIKNLKSAKLNRTIGAILVYPGAFAFGFTLGQSLNKNDQVKPNWTVGGIGAGMMIGGIIIESSGNKKLKEAAEEYNALHKTSSNFDPEISLFGSGDGVGFRFVF